MRLPFFLSALLVGCSSADPGGGGTPATRAFGAPNEQWTFVPIDGAKCGNGSPTGIGVNPTAASNKVVIFLEGGGACYEAKGCTGPMPSASHFMGYGATELADYAKNDGAKGIFDRTDPKNPFRGFNFVFVPYCTGDVHTGDKVKVDGGVTLNFVGQRNLKAMLPKVVANFPAPDKVVFAGSSAGGFGSMYDFWLVDDAFGGKNTLLIDDSGPFFPMPVVVALTIVVDLWGLPDTVAPGCPKCLDTTSDDGGLQQLIPLYAKTRAGRRLSLLSSVRDKTISERLFLKQDDFQKALTDLADKTVPLDKDMHVFFMPGETHVWLHGDTKTGKLSDVASNGTTLDVFLQREIDGDPAWADVRPKP